MNSYVLRAAAWANAFALVLAVLIVVGSRNLHHFDAALVGYTFATLFATFGITYRYAMWLARPPTRMYWRRGWRAFLSPAQLVRNLGVAIKRAVVEVGANRSIFRRDRMRGLTHMLLMWGCLVAAAITFPLVWGWIHFETEPSAPMSYVAYLWGFPAFRFPIHSPAAWLLFHGLDIAAVLVIAGVALSLLVLALALLCVIGGLSFVWLTEQVPAEYLEMPKNETSIPTL